MAGAVNSFLPHGISTSVTVVVATCALSAVGVQLSFAELSPQVVKRCLITVCH